MTGDRRPPGAAIRLLRCALPSDDAASIAGDLTELFADRIDRGDTWNALWFWSATMAIVLRFGIAGVRGIPRERRRRLMLDRLWTGYRQALRRLRYQWRYTLGVVVVLAVGIGPAAAMLSIAEKIWRARSTTPTRSGSAWSAWASASCPIIRGSRCRRYSTCGGRTTCSTRWKPKCAASSFRSGQARRCVPCRRSASRRDCCRCSACLPLSAVRSPTPTRRQVTLHPFSSTTVSGNPPSGAPPTSSAGACR